MKNANTKKSQKSKTTGKDAKVFYGPVVFTTIDQAKIFAKVSEYIDLVNDDSQSAVSWSSSLAVPNNAELHVYCLGPGTIKEQLMECMKKNSWWNVWKNSSLRLIAQL